MHGKDFDKWNGTKKVLNTTEIPVAFGIRQVWYTKVGANVRFEQDGKGDDFLRPVLIFRKFNDETFWGIPCTTQPKIGRYYCAIGTMDTKPNTAILSQLRLFSRARLAYQIGTCSQGTFRKLKEQVKQIIDDGY